MLSALFREYIVIFSEKQRKNGCFLFINRFLNFGGVYRGPLFFYFVYGNNITYVNKSIFLD